MVENYANDLIEKEFKKFAKSTKNSLCKFSYRSNYKKHSEQPIKLTIENMTLVEYPCCKRSLHTGHFNNTCPSSSVGILIVKTSVSLMFYLLSIKCSLIVLLNFLHIQCLFQVHHKNLWQEFIYIFS